MNAHSGMFMTAPEGKHPQTPIYASTEEQNAAESLGDYDTTIQREGALAPALMWMNLKILCSVGQARHKKLLYDSLYVKSPQ